MMSENVSPSHGQAAAILSGLLCLVIAVATVPVAAQGMSTAATPTLSLQRTIRTAPFVGSAKSMEDNEGSAFVPRDKSLWLIDDSGRRIYEVNPWSGALKRTIGPKALDSVLRFRGTERAGATRSRDLESLAYDAATDRLYAFAGADCKPSAESCRLRSRPTVFRLSRISGRLRLHSFQPLQRGSDNTAAAWSPRNKRVYVGNGQVIRAYYYNLNKYGPEILVPDLTDILGMGFTADGAGLLVARGKAGLSRVNWRTKSLVPGWNLGLSRLGVRDARGVEVIRRNVFFSDGYDYRPVGDRRRFAVFVFEVTS